MRDVRIGQSVRLTAPSGATRIVIVTDVIRDIFTKEVIALEFQADDELVMLSVKFFSLLDA